MKICRQIILIFSCLLLVGISFSQKKSAYVSGKVLDENENPLSRVSVVILGKQSGIITNDSGAFRLKVPADRAFAIQFTFSGYKIEQRNFLMNQNEEEKITVKMVRGATVLPGVTVSNQRDREIAGQIQINPKYTLNLPTPITGVESLIKIFVGSNNELTSQYNVRGGSYDENLVYVNDFEIFRPYL
ncbi:MAG: carboxypeptidase-like regulatory domain-containing protein, partial [Chitinophagales bacterium]